MIRSLFVDWEEPGLGNNSAIELEASARGYLWAGSIRMHSTMGYYDFNSGFYNEMTSLAMMADPRREPSLNLESFHSSLKSPEM